MMNEATYAEANRTYWTHRAPSYGDVNRKELATAQRRIWTQTLDVRIQARFPDRARSSIRVLDVGTGPGFFAVILNALGYAVTAVDYTNAMLNEARLNAGEAAEHIHFHCMDAEKLGFAASACIQYYIPDEDLRSEPHLIPSYFLPFYQQKYCTSLYVYFRH